MADITERLRKAIRDVPDFPKPGIVFKDITPALADPELLAAIVDGLAGAWRGRRVGAVVGVEARGFLFGVPLAMALGCSFVPARKPGKLPYRSLSCEYDLEYGTACLEMHVDAVAPGQRVLVVDDLLATGGTAAAARRLVERLGGEVVGASFVVELAFLRGREKLDGVPVQSLVTY